MRRTTSIAFILLYLLAFTECHQLVRFPKLLQHFRQHCAADPEMNFEKFIKIHYLSPKTITDDFRQDQQLPFRSVDCHMLNTVVFIYDLPLIKLDPVPDAPIVFYSYNEINKPQYAHFDIFQPPRQAELI